MSKKQEDIQQLENKVNDLEAQLKRAVADYHNLEKRIFEGRSELTKWGTCDLLTKLLPVLDHLDQALTGASETDKQSGWFKGVEMAVKEFKSVLESEGLEEITVDPSTSLRTGSVFNPSLHEALDTQVGEDNKILKVVKKGYNLNGKVLRPAGVVVGKRHSGESQSGSIESSDGDAIASLQHDERNDEGEDK